MTYLITCCLMTGVTAMSESLSEPSEPRRERRDRKRQRTRADRLDQPKGIASFGARFDTDMFGRLSEQFARFLGTGRFLVIQTFIVIVWITFNVVAVRLRWDPYPFILLNLAFSTQAAYAAPLILLAQNRQADRDRVQAEEDRHRAVAAKADTEYIARELAALRLAIGELATRDFVRSELSKLAAGEVDDRPKPKDKKRKPRTSAGD